MPGNQKQHCKHIRQRSRTRMLYRPYRKPGCTEERQDRDCDERDVRPGRAPPGTTRAGAASLRHLLYRVIGIRQIHVPIARVVYKQRI